MSIENSQVIDSISIDPQGSVVLTISDHLEWDENNEHLIILQNKINAYLSAIESGEIIKCYPEAQDRNIQIGIAFKFFPNEDALKFLRIVKEILKQSDYGLFYYKL